MNHHVNATESERFTYAIAHGGWAAMTYRYQQCALACMDDFPGLYIQALRGRYIRTA